MQDFEKLKNMDLDEVHRKTRITVAKLQDIINKDFDKIHKIRAKGFIKILERELHLDLKGWIEEYEAYHNRGTQTIQDKVSQNRVAQDRVAPTQISSEPKIIDSNKALESNLDSKNEESSKPKEIEGSEDIESSKSTSTISTPAISTQAYADNTISIKEITSKESENSVSSENNKRDKETKINKNEIKEADDKNSKKPGLKNQNISIGNAKSSSSKNNNMVKILSFGIVAILIIAFVVAISYNTKSEPSKEANLDSKEEAKSQAQMQKTQEVYPTISLEEAITGEKPKVDTDSLEQHNAASNTESKIDTNANDTPDSNINGSNADSSSAKDSNTNIESNIADSTLVITPQKEVWFAWVNLKTKEKGENHAKGQVSMKVDDEMIFHFGNMFLTISERGRVHEFQKAGVTYLFYSPKNGFRKISQKEFNALKRGAR